MNTRKRYILLLAVCLLFLLTGCDNQPAYTPEGEFYVKTSPSNGDAGVSEVIDLEIEKTAMPAGEGDTVVPVRVGFGHHPAHNRNTGEQKHPFYLHFSVVETPWQADRQPAWELQIDYQDSWYDAKYNSTEPEETFSFLWAAYGDFYPLYRENFEIVIPEEIASGYLEITLLQTDERLDDTTGEIVSNPQLLQTLRVHFEREADAVVFR